MSERQGEHGRGRRGELARRLDDACRQAGLVLLPGKARDLVDVRVREVAEQMRVTERTALSYFPAGWPEEMATSIALDVESSKLAETTAGGTVSVAAGQVARLITGLALVVQEAVWRSSNEQMNAGVGEPLDRLGVLSHSLSGLLGDVDVERSELLGAAGELGALADHVRGGGRFLHQDDVDRDGFARHLAADAVEARSAAAPLDIPSSCGVW